MVEGSDWLTPHFNYEERWQKPILYYWLTAAAFAGTGTTEFSGALRVGAFGHRPRAAHVVGGAAGSPANDDGAWIAGAIAATCFGYFAMARAGAA